MATVCGLHATVYVYVVLMKAPPIFLLLASKQSKARQKKIGLVSIIV